MQKLLLQSDAANDNRVEPKISQTKLLGNRGEEIASKFLETNGFRLVAANFVVPVGRGRKGVLINAEIDLIAYDGEILCFIEVKTRSSDSFVAPETNIDLRKQRQITRAAKVYRKIFRLYETTFRYDAVTVVLPDKASKPRIRLLKNFWTEAKFRKNSWKS